MRPLAHVQRLYHFMKCYSVRQTFLSVFCVLYMIHCTYITYIEVTKVALFEWNVDGRRVSQLFTFFNSEINCFRVLMTIRFQERLDIWIRLVLFQR